MRRAGAKKNCGLLRTATARARAAWRLLALCALAPSCTHVLATSEPAGTAARLALPRGEVRAVGRRLDGAIAESVRLIDDADVTRPLAVVADKVFARARADAPDDTFCLRVVEDRAHEDAFAVPGGCVYLTSGLILLVPDEAALAGVIAHEAAHVVADDALDALVAGYGRTAIARLAAGRDPALVAGLVRWIAMRGGLFAHGVDDETNADERAVRYLAEAGYDPRALLAFYQALRTRGGRPVGFLVDHPTPDERIARVDRFVVRHGFVGSRIGVGRVAQVKRRLAARATGRVAQ